MALSGQQAVQHYRGRERQAMEAAGWYRELLERSQEVRARTDAQLVAARVELARAYLPKLDDDTIARAEKLTGFRALSRRDPRKAMAHEALVLDNSIKRIAANERYRDRELLAGPDGTISTKMIETRDMLEPWKLECLKFEMLAGFRELVAVKYDTPAHSEHWWERDYWTHWSQGDAVCKALDMDDFGDDVLPAYQKVASQRDFWQAELEKLDAELAVVHQLVQNHDEAQQRRQRLPEIYLEQSQTLLADYLDQADFGLLEEWLGQEPEPDRAVLVGLRRCAGLKMKLFYLYELESKGLDPLESDLTGRARKYARKVSKFSRPKYNQTFGGRVIPESMLDNKFDAKFRKLGERRGKLQKLIDRIDRYDDYQRFSLDNDPQLWWHEFTGSKPPRQMPKTRVWYDQHPGVKPQHDGVRISDEDERLSGLAVAQAAASRELDDVGYLS